jgi:hypothetical protein
MKCVANIPRELTQLLTQMAQWKAGLTCECEDKKVWVLYFWYVTKIEIFLATQTLFLYA